MECIFCQIVQGKLPAKIALETDQVVAFYDINPSADTHILIVPREHIEGIDVLDTRHQGLLAEIFQAAKRLAAEKNLSEDSYRILVNAGKAQHVPHLHFHLLGGKWYRFV